MKVDMSKLVEEPANVAPKAEKAPKKKIKQVVPKPVEEEDKEEEEEDEYDNFDKHPKMKAFLLVTAMVGGLGLFVWNMTGFVNSMRLDNQGSASSIVYEMKDLNSFMGGSEGSGASADTGVEATEEPEENKASADTARDGPADSGETEDDADTWKKKAEDADNERALMEQKLKNAEDMLDSALQKLDGSSDNE